MEAKTIQINGVDFTSLFPPRGMTVNYQKVVGDNAGQMLDGSYTEDTIAVKAVVSSPLMPLTEEQQADFLQTLYSSDYASVYYFDPRKNAYRTAVMMYEIQQMKFKGTGGTGLDFWTGLAVTFTDRFDWSE